MTLPASYRKNFDLDPGAIQTIASGLSPYFQLAGTGGVQSTLTDGALGAGPNQGTSYKRATWTTGTTAVSGGMQVGIGSLTDTIQAAQPFSSSVYVRSSKIQRVHLKIQWLNNAFGVISSTTGTAVVLAANTWTRLSVSLGSTPANTVTYALFAEAEVGTSGVNWSIGDTFDCSSPQSEQVSAPTSFFFGGTNPNASTFKAYFFNGTVNNSSSREDYYGVYVEAAGNTGMPAATVYAAGLPVSNQQVRIIRSVGNDAWNVPGWSNRTVTSSDATKDWFVPYNVNVTYTMYLNGQALNSVTVNIPSTTGWICDPLQPDLAMPLNTLWTDSTVLTFGKASLKNNTYDAGSTSERVTGARYELSRGGQRSAAKGVPIQIYAHNNATSDQFRNMVLGGAFLLIKPLPAWGAASSIMYFDAPVSEKALNRDRGGSDTEWSWAGNLIAPVAQLPISGGVTYAAVATNIGARTYASVASASGVRKYVDIQAYPLTLGF